jgi:type III secretion system YscQ/HrcQ family protein
MHDISYDWLKLVEKALLKIQQLPALEEHFPFPWDSAAGALRESLDLSHLTLSCSRSVWKNHNEFLQGMGDQPAIVAIEIAPIEGALFFILPQADVTELTANVLVSGAEKETFSGTKLKQGFYHFLFLKILDTLDHLKIFKDVSLHLLPNTPFPHESGFCIDIACELPSRTLQGRLVCPQSFLSAFKAHQPLQKTTLLSLGETTALDLTLRCEVGHTSLKPDEWDSLQVGDFLILDRCSFDLGEGPGEGKGSLTVSLGETPLFIARFKPEGLKVLDYAFYQEATEAPQEEAVSSPTTDLLLTAEVGRLNISLHQLLQLKTGSLLDLPMRPEQGIDVTLGGKRMAKAELLKLGEASGLRILDIERYG